MTCVKPAACLLAGLVLAVGCSPGESPEGEAGPSVASGSVDAHEFRRLGRDDFDVFPASDEAEAAWTFDGETIRCSGDPRGYLYTKQPYENFTLRLEYRFPPSEADDRPPETSNTGVLVYVPDEHKLWPASLEVQGKHVEMGQIKSNSRDITIEVHDDEEARRKARKPVGEWNALVIVSRNGALLSRLNGVRVSESEAGRLTGGRIGLQSEDFAVEFRDVRIREE